MFYVYPLKFMFDSGFARILPFASESVTPMTFSQLSRASAIYGLGWIAVFIMFALLYLHAYCRRLVLDLAPLEIFKTKTFVGQHLVSAAVGVLVVLMALALPRRYAFIAPMAFIIMGPAHGLYGWRVGRRRKAFEAQLTPAAASHS